MSPIPVTVFTGFLGSGKTTIIRHLIQSLPKDYQIVLLKNEFGNQAIDSLLFQEQNLKVTEMINGCLCCVLVGKMASALREIKAKYQPQRVIIETSGSAYPAPIVLEINKLTPDYKLDAVINVVDALNFKGYKDLSYTAKNQCQYTDLILINKHELVNDILLEKVLDDVYVLNPSTPKIKTDHGKVDQDLIFGLSSNLTGTEINEQSMKKEHMHQEMDVLNLHTKKVFPDDIFDFFNSLPAWDFYRIKGLIRTNSGNYFYNKVFTRAETELLSQDYQQSKILLLGKNLRYHLAKIISNLNLQANEYKLQEKD